MASVESTLTSGPASWDGYKAVLSNGSYFFEETVTEGLTYTTVTPEVDKIYADGALVEVKNLYGIASGEDTSVTITVSTESYDVEWSQYSNINSIQLAASASDGGTPLFVATDLPAGISVSTAGLISGTPSKVKEGSFKVYVAYPGAIGKEITINYNTLLQWGYIELYAENLNLEVGKEFSYQYSPYVSNGGEITSYEAEGLPDGLTLSNTGLLSGTPTTEVSSGSFKLTVTAYRCDDFSTNFNYTVLASNDNSFETPYIWTDIASGTAITDFDKTELKSNKKKVYIKVPLSAGVEYTFWCISDGAGGFDEYLWLYDMDNNQLASNDDTDDGSKFTYTPETTGYYMLVLGSYNNGGIGKFSEITVTPAPSLESAVTPEITVTTPVTLTGTQNSAITDLQLTATVSDNGTPTFTSSDLPAGLTLSNTGLISGTPTGSGSGSSTITVSYSGAESKTITLEWNIEAVRNYVCTMTGCVVEGVNGDYWDSGETFDYNGANVKKYINESGYYFGGLEYSGTIYLHSPDNVLLYESTRGSGISNYYDTALFDMGGGSPAPTVTAYAGSSSNGDDTNATITVSLPDATLTTSAIVNYEAEHDKGFPVECSMSATNGNTPRITSIYDVDNEIEFIEDFYDRDSNLIRITSSTMGTSHFKVTFACDGCDDVVVDWTVTVSFDVTLSIVDKASITKTVGEYFEYELPIQSNTDIGFFQSHPTSSLPDGTDFSNNKFFGTPTAAGSGSVTFEILPPAYPGSTLPQSVSFTLNYTFVNDDNGGNSGSNDDKTYVYTVSGFSDEYAYANGDYYATGETSEGQPVYYNGQQYLLYGDTSGSGNLRWGFCTENDPSTAGIFASELTSDVTAVTKWYSGAGAIEHTAVIVKQYTGSSSSAPYIEANIDVQSVNATTVPVVVHYSAVVKNAPDGAKPTVQAYDVDNDMILDAGELNTTEQTFTFSENMWSPGSSVSGIIRLIFTYEGAETVNIDIPYTFSFPEVQITVESPITITGTVGAEIEPCELNVTTNEPGGYFMAFPTGDMPNGIDFVDNKIVGTPESIGSGSFELTVYDSTQTISKTIIVNYTFTQVQSESEDNGIVENGIYYISGCPEEAYNGVYTLTEMKTSNNELIFSNGLAYLYVSDTDYDEIGLQSTVMNDGDDINPVYKTWVGNVPANIRKVSDNSSAGTFNAYPFAIDGGKFVVSGFTNADMNGDYVKTDRKITGTNYQIYSNGNYDLIYLDCWSDWFGITPIGKNTYEDYIAQPNVNNIAGYGYMKSFIYTAPWESDEFGTGQVKFVSVSESNSSSADGNDILYISVNGCPNTSYNGKYYLIDLTNDCGSKIYKHETQDVYLYQYHSDGILVDAGATAYWQISRNYNEMCLDRISGDQYPIAGEWTDVTQWVDVNGPPGALDGMSAIAVRG